MVVCANEAYLILPLPTSRSISIVIGKAFRRTQVSKKSVICTQDSVLY